jgi:hypothetical protein
MTDKFGAKFKRSDFVVEASDNLPQPVAVTKELSKLVSANEYEGRQEGLTKSKLED